MEIGFSVKVAADFGVFASRQPILVLMRHRSKNDAHRGYASEETDHGRKDVQNMRWMLFPRQLHMRLLVPDTDLYPFAISAPSCLSHRYKIALTMRVLGTSRQKQSLGDWMKNGSLSITRESNTRVSGFMGRISERFTCASHGSMAAFGLGNKCEVAH